MTHGYARHQTIYPRESSPLPVGGAQVEGIVGRRNGERFGEYARIDLRANRDVLLANSKLSFDMEVTHLFDRPNECCIDGYDLRQNQNGQPYLDVQQGYWPPLTPSFGFQWEF